MGCHKRKDSFDEVLKPLLKAMYKISKPINELKWILYPLPKPSEKRNVKEIRKN